MKLITIAVSFVLGAVAALGATAIWAQQSGSPVPCTFTAPTLSCDLSGITAAGPAAATATAVPPRPPTVTPVAPGDSSQAPSPDMLLEMALAWRGDHAIPHEVTLPDPMGCCYSWGQHATEDTPSIAGDHTLTTWIAVMRSKNDLTTGDVRFNIASLESWVYTQGHWQQCDKGLDISWAVIANPDTSAGYQDITITHESDGTISFPLPPAPKVLHWGGMWPPCSFNGAQAVVSIVKARITGAGTANYWGVTAGADFRDASGSGSSIEQAGWGHLTLLLQDGTWKYSTMLSSSMTDEQIRATNPPF